MRLGPAALVALLALGAGAACAVGEPCGPEVRNTIAAGEFRDSTNARLASAEMGLAERRGDSVSTVYLSLLGASQLSAGPLQGHVTGVRVLDRGGAVVLAPDVTPVQGEGGGALVRTVSLTYTDSVAFRRLRERALAGELVVQVETSLGALPRFVVPLAVPAPGGWRRDICV